MRFVGWALNLLAVTVMFAGAASADTFYNNIGTTPVSYGSVLEHEGLYNSFSTGNTAENLTDVKVNVRLLGPATGSFAITLYANQVSQEEPPFRTPVADIGGSVNRPAAALLTIATVNDTAISATGTTYDYPINPGFPLSANTRYWIGITAANLSTVGWAWNDFSAGGAGTSNEYHCYGPVDCVQNGEDPFLMFVGGAVANVPALSPVALVSLGLLLLAIPLWMLRRKYRLPV